MCRGICFLSPVGYNFRSVSTFIVYYSCSLHRSWLSALRKQKCPSPASCVLPQSSCTVLRWVSTSDSSRGTEVVLGTDTTVDVKSPSYDPTCGYLWKKGRCASDLLWEPYQKQGHSAQLPKWLKLCLPPQDPRLAEQFSCWLAQNMKVRRVRTGWVLTRKANAEAKQVFCPCFLAKSCQFLWRRSFVLGSFFLGKKIFPPSIL